MRLVKPRRPVVRIRRLQSPLWQPLRAVTSVVSMPPPLERCTEIGGCGRLSDLDPAFPPWEVVRGEWVADRPGDDAIVERSELSPQFSLGPGPERTGGPLEQRPDVVIAAA